MLTLILFLQISILLSLSFIIYLIWQDSVKRRQERLKEFNQKLFHGIITSNNIDLNTAGLKKPANKENEKKTDQEDDELSVEIFTPGLEYELDKANNPLDFDKDVEIITDEYEIKEQERLLLFTK